MTPRDDLSTPQDTPRSADVVLPSMSVFLPAASPSWRTRTGVTSPIAETMEQEFAEDTSVEHESLEAEGSSITACSASFLADDTDSNKVTKGACVDAAVAAAEAALASLQMRPATMTSTAALPPAVEAQPVLARRGREWSPSAAEVTQRRRWLSPSPTAEQTAAEKELAARDAPQDPTPSAAVSRIQALEGLGSSSSSRSSASRGTQVRVPCSPIGAVPPPRTGMTTSPTPPAPAVSSMLVGHSAFGVGNLGRRLVHSSSMPALAMMQHSHGMCASFLAPTASTSSAAVVSQSDGYVGLPPRAAILCQAGYVRPAEQSTIYLSGATPPGPPSGSSSVAYVGSALQWRPRSPSAAPSAGVSVDEAAGGESALRPLAGAAGGKALNSLRSQWLCTSTSMPAMPRASLGRVRAHSVIASGCSTPATGGGGCGGTRILARSQACSPVGNRSPSPRGSALCAPGVASPASERRLSPAALLLKQETGTQNSAGTYTSRDRMSPPLAQQVGCSVAQPFAPQFAPLLRSQMSVSTVPSTGSSPMGSSTPASSVALAGSVASSLTPGATTPLCSKAPIQPHVLLRSHLSCGQPQPIQRAVSGMPAVAPAWSAVSVKHTAGGARQTSGQYAQHQPIIHAPNQNGPLSEVQTREPSLCRDR